MRFLMTYVPTKQEPPTPEKMAAIGRLVEENKKSGVLVDTGGMIAGPRVRLDKGKLSVTDGPFPETKELIIGYAIVEVPSLEAAIEEARKFMAIAGDGEGLLRQLSAGGEGEH